jgi:hypothetical protein
VCVCVRACVCVCTYSSRRDAPICTKISMLNPWGQEKILERLNSRKVSWIQVLVRAIPLARKLSMLEEQHQDHSCLFRRGYYRNEGQNPENLSCVRFPVKIVSVARKLNAKEERCQRHVVCFGEEITATKTITTNICHRFESQWR